MDVRKNVKRSLKDQAEFLGLMHHKNRVPFIIEIGKF